MTRRRVAGIWTTVAAMTLVCAATLIPVADDGVVHAPWWCVSCGSLSVADAVVNVALFVPLGIGLALLRWRAAPAIAAMACVSVAVEVAQALAIPGRDSSLRDVITNTCGGALGVALVHYWRPLLVPRPAHAWRLAAAAVAMWVLALGVTPALSRPSLPLDGYWAQRGGPADFGGSVMRVALNDMDIRLGPLTDDEHRVINTLNSSDVRVDVAFALVSTRPVTGQIARVANHRTDAFRLVRRGDDLVFFVRARAADLRLRNPIVRLHGALGDAGHSGSNSPGDVIRVSARFREGVLRLERHAATSLSTELRLSPMMGWAYLAPTGLAWRGASWLFAAMWVGALLFPVGYFTMAAHAGSRAAAFILRAVVAAVVVGAMTLIPPMTGTPWPSWWDWCAGVVGAGCGALAAVIVRRLAASRPEY